MLWQHRSSYVATGVLSFSAALTSVLGWYLLDRADGFVPWLKWVVLVVGLAAALALAGIGHLPRKFALAVAATALAATLAGPAAYAVSTASTPHAGSIPSAGPSMGTGGPGGMGGGPRGQFGPPGGTATQGQNAPTQGQAQPQPQTATRGGAGGLLNGSTPTAEVTELLQNDADSYTWAAAAVGANNAAGYQLASEQPVMAIGGFNGSDPSPTLAQFQQYVADGQIHWFIAGGGMGGGPGGNGSNAISRWVEDNFTATTVDGATLYDLSGGIR